MPFALAHLSRLVPRSTPASSRTFDCPIPSSCTRYHVQGLKDLYLTQNFSNFASWLSIHFSAFYCQDPWLNSNPLLSTTPANYLDSGSTGLGFPCTLDPLVELRIPWLDLELRFSKLGCPIATFKRLFYSFSFPSTESSHQCWSSMVCQSPRGLLQRDWLHHF